MVHSSPPLDVKPASVGSSGISNRHTPIRRKRLSEPRPHPSHCLNKRFWDEVRAGRLPKPHSSSLNVDKSKNKTQQKTTEATNHEKERSSKSPSSVEIPLSNRRRSSVPSPQQPSTSSRFQIGSTSSMPPIPIQSMPFWSFMPPNAGLPYQMPPGFMPMPAPYVFPCIPPQVSGGRPDQFQFMPILPPQFSQPTRQQSPEQTINVTDEPNNNSSVDRTSKVQFVPIPIPIPIPLTNSFVMKHFGR